MRLLVSTVLALAVAALAGVSLVGVSPSEGRPSHVGTGRFFAGPPSWASGGPAPGIGPLRRVGVDSAQALPEYREFFFTRGVYSGYGRGWGRRSQSWATDYPKADRQFLVVLKRLVDLDGYDYENAVRLDDPNLRRFPFLYTLEVGYMNLTDAEVEGLRSYLEAGGFLVVDDFWGSRQWENFAYQMSRVLPGRTPEPIPPEHPIFHTVYDIDEVKQVPAVGRGLYGRPTWEQDGFVPVVLGITDDDGRLMVVVNWNTDLGDAWEHAENPYYPLEYSTFAYEMGVNMVVYGMSH